MEFIPFRAADDFDKNIIPIRGDSYRDFSVYFSGTVLVEDDAVDDVPELAEFTRAMTSAASG